ncbi:PREDICTED: E3 ubiquitin-protein ligase NRDP1 [Ficedula albicollis]|uniref:E3 ubiquitin-protein ligase NRDP1 n=1 Tax=Ficedula albicollis TaxID=59894 RepID=UPI0007AD8CE3|nr:PREDICTED: E3 ubiquitin-protein ligase NRDP1 [Ficedula albicollis]
MGYDVARFQGDVDEDLICPICSGVLEEPVQVRHTWAHLGTPGHTWASVMAWTRWEGAQIPPGEVQDRHQKEFFHGKGDHAQGGLEEEKENPHLLPEFSPNLALSISHTWISSGKCKFLLIWSLQFFPSLEMPKDELPNHNCIKHLRSVVQQQQTRIAELEKTSAEHKHQLAEQKRDIQLLKAYMRAIRSVNPNLQNLEETIEYNEILE